MIPRRDELDLERYRVMLTAYVQHLVGSPHLADDLVQEIFLVVLRDPMVLQRGRDVGAYLRGIGRHLASRHYRSAKRDPVLLALVEVAWEEPSDTDQEQDLATLRDCMKRLTERVRKVLSLRYDNGFACKGIASNLGSTATAVRMTLCRARRALADCIRGELASQEGGEHV